jgi:anti-sigma regulatory factor (Ser/Thr protein kinase)
MPEAFVHVSGLSRSEQLSRDRNPGAYIWCRTATTIDVTIATPRNDVVVAFPVTPNAPGAARRLLLSEGLDPDLDHTVCLLASELVTNAIRHSGKGEDDRIVLAARLSPDFARIEVRDPGPGFDPDVRHGGGGFGLRMLDALAARWGVDCTERGTRVWFEVDRRRRRFSRG